MQRRTIFNSSISVGTYPEFIEEIFSLVEYKIPSYVCFANVHMVVEAHHDNAFQIVMNNANVVAPDGKPISLLLKYFENLNQERVCGMDILPDLLRRAEVLGKSVYFYGTTNQLLETIAQKVKKEFPTLKISGWYSPPFKELSREENTHIIDTIKKTSPDLVFVSLGCPKQEKWMAENRNKLGACLLGVGQAFTIYAGVEKRLPKWMRNLSLEWMYRLYQEPQRLWRRYLYTNSYFLLLTGCYLADRIMKSVSAPFRKEKTTSTILRESEEHLKS